MGADFGGEFSSRGSFHQCQRQSALAQFQLGLPRTRAVFQRATLKVQSSQATQGLRCGMWVAQAPAPKLRLWKGQLANASGAWGPQWASGGYAANCHRRGPQHAPWGTGHITACGNEHTAWQGCPPCTPPPPAPAHIHCRETLSRHLLLRALLDPSQNCSHS